MNDDLDLMADTAEDNNGRAVVYAINENTRAVQALAEQQRIANLIALGQYTIVPGDMPAFRSVIFEGDALRSDIKDALGLGGVL